jgi:hypothetical protein
MTEENKALKLLESMDRNMGELLGLAQGKKKDPPAPAPAPGGGGDDPPAPKRIRDDAPPLPKNDPPAPAPAPPAPPDDPPAPKRKAGFLDFLMGRDE